MTTTADLNVLIIGTGIAGPIAPMAIQQADIQPTIYEAGIETSEFSAGHAGCPAPTVSLSHRRSEFTMKALLARGGIAGPTMALALERAGIDAEVFEAYDQPADYTGLFLSTASNGVDALRVIGVEVADHADGSRCREW